VRTAAFRTTTLSSSCGLRTRWVSVARDCAPAPPPTSARQIMAVYDVMKDGRFRTLAEIANAAKPSEASASARIRDLKKRGIQHEKRRSGPGLFGVPDQIRPWSVSTKAIRRWVARRPEASMNWQLLESAVRRQKSQPLWRQLFPAPLPKPDISRLSFSCRLVPRVSRQPA
jgi:hypothetical protein